MRDALREVRSDPSLPDRERFEQRLVAAEDALEGKVEKSGEAFHAARRGLSEQSAEKKAWLRCYRGIALIAEGLFTYRSGLDAAEFLLRQPNPPTAIFASNDDMAAACVAVAHSQGLAVPGDLTVCGFDDTAMATTIWPELTTVRQPIGEMSRAALRRLQVRDARSCRGERPRSASTPPSAVTRSRRVVRYSNRTPRSFSRRFSR